MAHCVMNFWIRQNVLIYFLSGVGFQYNFIIQYEHERKYKIQTRYSKGFTRPLQVGNMLYYNSYIYCLFVENFYTDTTTMRLCTNFIFFLFVLFFFKKAVQYASILYAIFIKKKNSEYLYLPYRLLRKIQCVSGNRFMPKVGLNLNEYNTYGVREL